MKAAVDRVYRHARPRDPAPVPRLAPVPEPPSNGGPAIYASRNEELVDIGEAIYGGEAWITRMAFHACVHERQMRRWAAGSGEPTEACMGNARREFVKRYRAMQATARRIGVDTDEGI